MDTNKDYVVVSCISIVVACNAGGVISPFGDVTSLMVWQKEKLSFIAFFNLLLPGIVNWLVPAGIMVRLPSPTWPPCSPSSAGEGVATDVAR